MKEITYIFIAKRCCHEVYNIKSMIKIKVTNYQKDFKIIISKAHDNRWKYFVLKILCSVLLTLKAFSICRLSIFFKFFKLNNFFFVIKYQVIYR